MTKLQEALKKSNAVSMIRYEFEKKLPESNYPYIFRVGDIFFDLPENMAKNLIKELNLELGIYPYSENIGRIDKKRDLKKKPSPIKLLFKNWF